jgi:hypothetical protein
MPIAGGSRVDRLRHRGARVFFRRVGDTIEILAKASKKNEEEVINMLKKLYED